jgi:hypothetical protein
MYMLDVKFTKLTIDFQLDHKLLTVLEKLVLSYKLR